MTMVMKRKNHLQADCWPPAVTKPKNLTQDQQFARTVRGHTHPAMTRPVTFASAPLKLNSVRAILSSSGSKTARINLNADGIYYPVKEGSSYRSSMTHSCSTGDTAQSSEDEVGVLVRHERNDEVDDAQGEKAVAEDGFGRVQIGYSAPEEEEGSEGDGVCSLSLHQLIGLTYRTKQTMIHEDDSYRTSRSLSIASVKMNIPE